MKWFTFNPLNHQVRGPFTKIELKELQDDSFEESLFWSPTLNQWLNYADWSSKDWESQLKVISPRITKEWHFAFQGQDHGPFSFENLISELRTQTAPLTSIYLWHKNLEDWEKLYSFPEVLKALDVEKRKNPRFTVKGSVFLETTDEKSFLAQLQTVSRSGFGILTEEPISQGDQVTITLKTLLIDEAIKATAVARNINGYKIGFSFENLTTDMQAPLVDLLNILAKQQEKKLSRKMELVNEEDNIDHSTEETAEELHPLKRAA